MRRALRDPCESTLTQAGWYRARARPCLVKVLNSIPLPMMHEFELPGAIGYHNVTTVDPTAPFTLDIVLAVHSSPVAELLDAMASALDTQVQATVWIYQKGQLTSQERKRLNAFQRLQVKWKRLENGAVRSLLFDAYCAALRHAARPHALPQGHDLCARARRLCEQASHLPPAAARAGRFGAHGHWAARSRIGR